MASSELRVSKLEEKRHTLTSHAQGPIRLQSAGAPTAGRRYPHIVEKTSRKRISLSVLTAPGCLPSITLSPSI